MKKDTFTSHRASYEAAGQSDFIFPMEVEKALNLNYSKEGLEYFLQTLPPKEEMKWYKKNDFIFIPGPPEIFSMEKIISIEPHLFSFSSEKIKEICFSFNLETSWIIMSKKSLMHENYYFIESELGERIFKREDLEYSYPSPAVLAWAMIVYKKTRGMCLLEGCEVISSAGDGYNSPISRRFPIMFTWTKSLEKIIVYKLGAMSSYIDTTIIANYKPLVVFKYNDDLPF